MKYLKFGIVTVIISIVAVFAIKAVQTTEAVIVVEAISNQEIHDGKIDTTKYHSPSTGLKVVGRGELVYLSGKEAGGDSVTAFAWTLTPPAGSNATLDATNTEMVTFRPDTTGQFKVDLTITTNSGTADTSVTITSAEYVGVGTVGGQNPSFAKGQCAVCHADKESEWQGTGHATKFTRAIDGIDHTFYAESCIKCHTVGYNDDPTAVNGGFDDVQKALGWTFPDTVQAGNWDDIVTNFPDLATVSNIQCENCHGPGSLHKGDKTKIDVTIEEGMCGKCHDELTHHYRSTQWKRSLHAVGVGFAAGNSSCAGCHSGYGFIDRMENKTELRTGFPQISCAVCHDPHSAANEHQLRKVDDVTLENGEVVTFGSIGKLCMQCHHSRRDAETYSDAYHDHYGPHHNPQADMLAGTNAITFGVHIPSSNHRFYVEEACVQCHMAETPAAGEPGQHWVGEHTWNMHWDGGTPDDPSDDVYNVKACQECHGSITSFADIKAKMDYDGDGAIEGVQDEIDGMLDELGKLLPPLGDPAVNVIPEDYDPTLAGLTPEEVAQRKLYLKAAYNYFFVEDDGSHGVHNFQYAMNLLKVAHKALTTGSLGAGMITSITDVPNDQGKQVRVAWNRFGGDGIGNNPVRTYALWRRVDDVSVNTSQQNLAVHESFDMKSADVKELNIGTRVEAAGSLWDFAGTVPAAGHDQYNAITPTLFDSTAADGIHWSIFVVSGHTAIPAVQAVSAPDSGYSVDNLAPTAPANLVGKETEMGVALSWDDAVDADFNYFALYRSTAQGFDPGTVEPIKQLTETSYVDMEVTVGSTYYYRLSAYDFAGNESAYSREFSLMITAVEGSLVSAIPEHYVLQQNYPNPFNPSTTISFGLKESGQVTLTVYNSLGEEVIQVINSQMEAGFHRAVIRSENLSSGVYFYQIRVNNFTSVKKMIVMK